MKRLALVIGMLCTVCLQTEAQYVSEVCVADQGNGTYRNPVLHADYSDPDVCAVGDDFYMTASSFGCTPGSACSPFQRFGELAYRQLCLEGTGAEKNFIIPPATVKGYGLRPYATIKGSFTSIGATRISVSSW